MCVSSIKSDSTWLEVYVFANGLHLSSQVTIGTYVYIFASKNIHVLGSSRVVQNNTSYPYALTNFLLAQKDSDKGQSQVKNTSIRKL